jgi:hypothetical protein
MSRVRDVYPYFPYKILGDLKDGPLEVINEVTNVLEFEASSRELALSWIAGALSQKLEEEKGNSIYRNNTAAIQQPPLLFRLQRLGELLGESVVEASADDEFETLTKAAQIILRWRLGHERNLNHLKVKDELTKQGIKVRGNFGYKQDLPFDPNNISGVADG